MTVVNAPPTVVVPAAATPVGTTVVLSALGADDGGEANLIYTWAATSTPDGATPAFAANGAHAARSTVATVDAAGAYAFAVTISDGTNAVTSTVVATVTQTLAGLTVAPGTAAVNLNGTQPFAAAGVDQFGHAVTAPVTWAVLGVGTIDAAGLYTAGPIPGTATILATTAGTTGQATVAVTNAAPTIAAPAAISTTTATTAALSVRGADDGGEAALTYTWSVVAGPAAASPTFPLNGTHAAGDLTATFDQAGSYTLRATVTDPFGATATSDVAVTVGQVLSARVRHAAGGRDRGRRDGDVRRHRGRPVRRPDARHPGVVRRWRRLHRRRRPLHRPGDGRHFGRHGDDRRPLGRRPPCRSSPCRRSRRPSRPPGRRPPCPSSARPRPA